MQGFVNRIMDKFFCRHKWQSLVIKEYQWEEEKTSLKSTKENQIVNTSHQTSTTQFFVCELCGKIKKLEY